MHTWGNHLVPELLLKLSDSLPIQYWNSEHVHEEVPCQNTYFWQSNCLSNLAILYGLCIIDSSFLYWPLLCGGGRSNKYCLFQFSFEPGHDKTYKMTCAPNEDSDQPGHQPSLISLRCPHEETLGPLATLKCTTKNLVRLGGCLGWSESLLGTRDLVGFVMLQSFVCRSWVLQFPADSKHPLVTVIHYDSRGAGKNSISGKYCYHLIV